VLRKFVDIRPVTVPDADNVLAIIHRTIAEQGADGAHLNGWDRLLETGLPAPTLSSLDAIAPETPLLVIHNSGHRAYFNSAQAALVGVNRNTPDPAGSSYGRGSDGELDASASSLPRSSLLPVPDSRSPRQRSSARCEPNRSVSTQSASPPAPKWPTTPSCAPTSMPPRRRCTHLPDAPVRDVRASTLERGAARRW
jgi:hypothetical protein